MAYDLTPILEAIETIVNKKVSDAQYTKILTGKIKSQIQDNIYEVAFDNNSILAKTTGNIQLEINDTVKLLQINGAENVNENTFILGKSEDLARAGFDINVGELKNIVSIAGLAITTSLSWAQEININFSDSDINKIKKVLIDQQLCCLKAKFKLTDNFKKDHANGHYGLKLAIQYTNTTGVSKTIEEKLDIVDMVGEPYKFFNEVEQQKIFKLNLYDLLEINSINLIAYTKDFGNTSNDIILEINNINFATVQYTEKGNKYTVELDGGSTRACFVSKTQQDINTYTLLAQVKKNDNNFVNKNLVYYWFKKNPTIKVGNDLYCSYGGEGWTCLNKSYIQSIVAVGSTLEDAEKRKVWEDSGNKLIISEADTLQYHNYYKCVVVYNNDIVISSIEKDIINLDRNEVNIYFTVEPNQKSFTSKEQTFKLTCHPTEKNYSWYYLDDQNNKFELAESSNVLNFTGADVNIDNYNYVTIVCEVTDGGDFIGQAARVFNNNLMEQYQEKVEYCFSADGMVQNIQDSDWQSSIDNSWYNELPGYIFVKTTDQNNFSEISCYWDYRDDIGASSGVHYINGEYAKQTTAFNNMTKGGKEEGIWFGEDDKLLINANCIKTGSLAVGSLFSVDIGNPEVIIGGFTVSSTALCWPKNNIPNTENEYVYLGQKGLKLGNKFSIDQKGNVGWSSDNSPIKQKYAETPAPLNSDKWHNEKTENDLYFIQSSDGGNTWAGPYLIQGQDGKSIESIKNYFYASELKISNFSTVTWENSPEAAGYSEIKKYLYVKQEVTYTDKTISNITPYLSTVWGASENLDRSAILNKLELTSADGIYEQNGLIGINATAIKTGALLVGNVNNPLFKAGWDTREDGVVSEVVTIGGFKVTNDRLYSGQNENNTYVALSSSESNGYRIWAGREDPSKAPFWVKDTGEIYSTSGTIGGFSINTSSLYTTATNINNIIFETSLNSGINKTNFNQIECITKQLPATSGSGSFTIDEYSFTWSAISDTITFSLNIRKTTSTDTDKILFTGLSNGDIKLISQGSDFKYYMVVSQYMGKGNNPLILKFYDYNKIIENLSPILKSDIDNTSFLSISPLCIKTIGKGVFGDSLICNNSLSVKLTPQPVDDTKIDGGIKFIKDEDEKTSLREITFNKIITKNITATYSCEQEIDIDGTSIDILTKDGHGIYHHNMYYKRSGKQYYTNYFDSVNGTGYMTNGKMYLSYVIVYWTIRNDDTTLTIYPDDFSFSDTSAVLSDCSLYFDGTSFGHGFQRVYGGLISFGAAQKPTSGTLSATNFKNQGGYYLGAGGNEITFFVDEINTSYIDKATCIIFGVPSSGSSS